MAATSSGSTAAAGVGIAVGVSTALGCEASLSLLCSLESSVEEELLLDVERDEELEFDLLRGLGRVCDFEPSGSTLNLC